MAGVHNPIAISDEESVERKWNNTIDDHRAQGETSGAIHHQPNSSDQNDFFNVSRFCVILCNHQEN